MQSASRPEGASARPAIHFAGIGGAWRGLWAAGAWAITRAALGDAPQVSLLVAAALCAGAALPPLSPRARRAVVAGAGLCLWVLDPAVAAGAARGLPGGAALAAAVGSVLAAAAALSGGSPGRAGAAGVALGLGLGVLLPGPVALGLGALGAWLRPGPPAAAGAPGSAGWTAGLGAAAGVGWVALRPGLDPSADWAPWLLVVGVAAAAVPAVRALGPGAGALALAATAAALSAAGANTAPAIDALVPLLGVRAPGALLLVGAAGVGGLAGLGGARGRFAAAGLAGGLALAAVLAVEALILAAAASGLAAAALGRGVGTRVSGGVALAAGAALTVFAVRPSPALLAASPVRGLRGPAERAADAAARDGQVALAASVDAAAAWALRTPAPAGGPPPRDPLLIIEADGRLAATTGRPAEAEALAGHLGALLAPRAGTESLIIGDIAGNAARALVHHPVGSATVAAGPRSWVRAAAAANPTLAAVWLSPRLRLVDDAGGPARFRRGGLDLLLEVSRGPEGDAWSPAPRAAALAAAARRLAPGGVYVYVTPLDGWSTEALATFAADFAAALPAAQLWLPPAGVESAIFVGSAIPLPLARLEARFDEAAGPLRTLGFPEAAALASHAVVGGATLAASPRSLTPPGWGRARILPPALPLRQWASAVGPAAALWDLRGAATEAVALDAALERRATFLRILDDASTGQLDAVFAASRALTDGDRQDAVRALDPLIAPHLEQATAALARAKAEGPSSAAWGDAQRFAGTARMLSPASPEPLVLQGEIALAQGNPTAASTQFSSAVDLDPTHEAALLGLARAARARGDTADAERWFRLATERHPRRWAPWANLGRHLMDTGQLGPADEALQRAAALSDGQVAAPQLALAELYLQAQRPAAALVHAERAAALGAGAPASYLRGRAHFDLGEISRAESDFRQAVLEDPSLIAARGGIGHCRALAGDLDSAVEIFRQVATMDPANAAARENLRRAERLQAEQNAGRAPLPGL